MGDHCPDTFVVKGIQNKEQIDQVHRCKRWRVSPAFIIEVVSPRYRSRTGKPK
jgi:Uma2 family endonuclease